MNNLINPNKLEVRCKRWNNTSFAGGKVYLPVLVGNGYARSTRRVFQRASEAETYGERVRQRWIRLHAVALASLLEPTL